MRLVSLAFAAALALASAPGRAEGPVRTQPLAPGEVLLELSAVGTARSRADLASFTALITTPGATAAEALRANEQAVERVAAAARSVGVAPADISVDDMVDPDVEMMATIVEGPLGLEGAEGPRPRHVVRSSMQVRLRDPGRVSALKQAFREAGADQVSGPTYLLSDDRPARRAARADALATARIDAEAYAAALGMRVLRVVHVTERLGMEMTSLLFSNTAMMRSLRGGAQSDPDVETQVIVGVDFALAPQ